MVSKPSGSYRMAIDYHQLNAVTIFHAEPSCNIEGVLYRFSGASFFSELGLSKGYYEVSLSERAGPLTAFPTHLDLMEYCWLPLRLVTACANYIRLMGIVLERLSNVFLFRQHLCILDRLGSSLFCP